MTVKRVRLVFYDKLQVSLTIANLVKISARGTHTLINAFVGKLKTKHTIFTSSKLHTAVLSVCECKIYLRVNVYSDK